MIDPVQQKLQLEGKLYDPIKLNAGSFARVQRAQRKFNNSDFWEDRTALYMNIKKCHDYLL